MSALSPWDYMMNWISGTRPLHPEEDPEYSPVVDSARSTLNIPKDASSLSREELIDKIKGTIYGNALGDALGLATEFMSKKMVSKVYAGKEITFDTFYPDGHRRRWVKGDWTDDTDQMILILNSILHHGGKPERKDFAKRLKFWTKKGFPELGDIAGMGLGATVGKVVNQEEFENCPHLCAETVWLESGRQVAANGAVMRTSICGIPSFYDISAVEEQAIDMCKVTHADPRCIASVVSVCVAIALMLQGKAQEEVLKTAIHRASQHVSDGQVNRSEQQAKDELIKYLQPQSLEGLKLDESEAIGYTYKALGCAFYALTATSDDGGGGGDSGSGSGGLWKEVLIRIIKEGGDADTNGAVAGAVLGCKVGYSQLPQELLNQMPHKDWLEQKINKLLTLMSLSQ